jgi:hypothetical protein
MSELEPHATRVGPLALDEPGMQRLAAGFSS